DEILKIADGEERMTVAEVDGLLYLPEHSHDQLERAVRINALSGGWKSSLKALLDQHDSGAQGTGNAGLTATAARPPAWTGFRSLRVARVDGETASVVSVVFEAPDGSPLPAALPGQFVIVKIRPNPDLPPVLRNYSLSGAIGTPVYRISVKREPKGIASN